MRPAQACAPIGCRMRELRQSTGISLRRAAELSGWNKTHLSRVESGSTKPSLPLVEWYDDQFGADHELIVRYREHSEPVRAEGDRGPARALPADGRLPPDQRPRDTFALVAQTVPDRTLVRPDHVLRKTWTLRNTGPVPWRDRWLTRQVTSGGAGWEKALRCPTRVPVPDTGSGGVALIELDVITPKCGGPSVAYFRITDVSGRLYFPDPAVPPLRCSLYVTD